MYHGERFNAWTHLVGAVLSVIGTIVLVVMAAFTGDPWKIVSASIFGAMLVLLYSASTIYHSVRGQTKQIFKKLDHFSIYLLIAGTYTPFTLIALPGAWGWSLFAAVWTLALVGSVLELGGFRRWRKLAVLLYVGMGWIGMLAFKPLAAHLQAGGMDLLVGGGVAYTLGVPFYLWRRLPYQHTLWHAFVLAGSVLHYFAVLLYVLPAGSLGT